VGDMATHAADRTGLFAGIKLVAAASRLPFVSASLLPYLLGLAAYEGRLDALHSALGLAVVLCAHLSANVANDWADSRSGVDWHDTTPYGFFGGSKLIQRGVADERFFLRLAAAYGLAALGAAAALAALLRSAWVPLAAGACLAAGWAYTARPLRLSYRRLGEPLIALLFGPAIVHAALFVQEGTFAGARAWALSAGPGLMVALILVCNEVPDHPADAASGKRTWIDVVGPRRGWMLHAVLGVAGALAGAATYAASYAGWPALLSLAAVAPVARASAVLRRHWNDMPRLTVASRYTIAAHAVVCLSLIAGVCT